MIVQIIAIIGILIPISGIFALIRNNQHSENTLRLMLTNIGCLIMNSGYFLILLSDNEVEASTALKIEYLGEAMFYLFFIMFLQSYLQKCIPQILNYFWVAFECILVGFYWVGPVRNRFIGAYTFTSETRFNIYTAQVEANTLYLIRNSILCLLLFIGLIYTAVRMFGTKLKTERYNLARLSGAQFVVSLSLVIQLIVNPAINIVPLFGSLSIFSVILSVIRNEFFRVTDSGHEWVFEQMDNAYIIVDSLYGYLDSNNAAKKLFPCINEYRQNERISEQLYEIFTSEEKTVNIEEKFFEKEVTQIKRADKIIGYGLLLEDITLLHNYNTQLHKEVNEKTKHIQLVQDSIITGMASVVESRDNSTGGHINRTSMVVKTFSQKLAEHSAELKIDEAFLNTVVKAAPMHDIGKIAVDDVVLRKPGKFTDEEYAKMKRHSAEGAKMLQKILSEVNDEYFKQIAINVAQYHHERYDGKGYPNGVSGENIPLEARIMSLADVFDALVSKRCYKDAFTYDKAFSIIEEGLGTQFDPVLGRLFSECRPELENLYNNME